MGKIENLEKYIIECDSMMNLDSETQYNFILKVVGIYVDEIRSIKEGLDAYMLGATDYSFDIESIKAKLVNYKDNIELEEQKRKNELELAKLRQGTISVSANANNSNSININISLEQVMECINQIPDDVLTKEEKSELEDKISGIDVAVKCNNKEKAKDKIFTVLKFLADKGADALIAILPYLGQMAGIIGS